MNEHGYDFDYFVIGAGSAGVRSARIAASHGAKVGIAEASALGGTCVNLGCVPKKILAYGADYSGHFRDAKGYGWDVPDDIEIDWEKLIKNQRSEVSRLNNAYENTLSKAGVEIFNGYAKFVDPHTLDIDGKQISADKILIAVGGKPRTPYQEGGECMPTSDDMFSWTKKPKRAVILGGGYIAVEFARILHGVGAQVDLLYRGDLILRGFDDDVRNHLAETMQDHGINIHNHCDMEKCDQTEDGFIVHGSNGKKYECDVALAAIGRVPAVDGLELKAADVSFLGNGQVDVNEDYQTSQPHIYACGDVANQDNLTPVAIKEGHVIADRLFNKQRDRNVNYDNIATAVFSDPPIGTVGLTEEKAKEEGYEVQVYSSKFTPMRNQLANKKEKTLMKMIVDAKSDRVLGLHMVGLDAPEIIQGFAVAMNCGATKADFDRTMPVHPTSAEEFVTLK